MNLEVPFLTQTMITNCRARDMGETYFWIETRIADNNCILVCRLSWVMPMLTADPLRNPSHRYQDIPLACWSSLKDMLFEKNITTLSTTYRQVKITINHAAPINKRWISLRCTYLASWSSRTNRVKTLVGFSA